MAGEDGVTRARLFRTLRWWPPLFALWLLFVGEWSWLVGIWGAGMAAVAAAAAEVVAGQGLLNVRGRWRWCGELGSAAVAVPADAGILTWELVRAIATGRRRVGVFREDASAAGEGPLPAGRRAWVEFVATWSPNCYVVDVSSESGRRMIHDLRPHRPSERPS